MIELRCDDYVEGPLRVGVSAFDFRWLVPSPPMFIIRLSRIGVPEFLGAKGERLSSLDIYWLCFSELAKNGLDMDCD